MYWKNLPATKPKKPQLNSQNKYWLVVITCSLKPRTYEIERKVHVADGDSSIVAESLYHRVSEQDLYGALGGMNLEAMNNKIWSDCQLSTRLVSQ